MQEFDIKRLVENVIEKKVVLLVILLVSAITGVVYTFLIKQPVYTSRGKIILEKADASANELVKSDEVLKEVINNLNLKNISIGELRNKIIVSYTKETKMIQVIYSSKNNVEAKDILSEIVRVYMIKLNEVYNIKNAKIIEEPILQSEPENINHAKDLITFISLGIVIIGIYIFIYNIMDTTIRSVEDIESLNINLLGIVPKQEKEVKKKK